MFPIDLKSLYTNIPVDDAIRCIQKLCFEFQVFDGEYFQQIFGLIMGTNVTPILTNIYMALLEIELKNKCKSDPKLIWPVLFKRFIDDGFGVTTGLFKDILYWIENSIKCFPQFQRVNQSNKCKQNMN